MIRIDAMDLPNGIRLHSKSFGSVSSARVEKRQLAVSAADDGVFAVFRKRSGKRFEREVAIFADFLPGGGIVKANDRVGASSDHPLAVRTDVGSGDAGE